MIRRNNNGSITFEFFRAEANHVAVVGSFNNWSRSSHRMCRDENGLWSIHLDDIEPGDHQFKYCVDGRDWYPDFAAHGVELDDHGEWRSLLIVNDIEREPMLQFQGIEVLSAKTGVSDPAFAPAVARVHELPSHAAAADPRRQAA